MHESYKLIILQLNSRYITFEKSFITPKNLDAFLSKSVYENISLLTDSLKCGSVRFMIFFFQYYKKSEQRKNRAAMVTICTCNNHNLINTSNRFLKMERSRLLWASIFTNPVYTIFI